LEENHGIRNILIEDCKGNIIVDKRQVLKIWENHIRQTNDRPNRPKNLEVETEEEVDSINFYSKYFTKESLGGFGDFRIGQVIRSVICAGDLVLVAKEETVLKGMFDCLIDLGRCYRMEMNVEKTKVTRISRQPSPIQIAIGHNQLENVEYFNYLRNMITNDARCTPENKSRIVMARAAIYKQKALSTIKNWS
jgi:hypothetical protein